MPGAPIAPPVTTPLAIVAKAYPAEIRLPPYAGTQTYRFRSLLRVGAILESGGQLFATVAARGPGDTASLLELRGRRFVAVPLPGGPFVSLEITQTAPTFALLTGTTNALKPVQRRFMLFEGRLSSTTRRGDGTHAPKAAGVRCLDARRSSTYDGPALVVFDQRTGRGLPSIAKDALSRATGDASSDLSLSISCHSFGPDEIVWLEALGVDGQDVAPSGVSLLAGRRLRPLANVAPLAVSPHYMLFAQGDPTDDSQPLTYTLLRSN